MPAEPLAVRYRAAQQAAGGGCPIEAGFLGRLADFECRHGRLAFDTTAPCGCWPEEQPVPRLAPAAHRDALPISAG